MSEEPPTPRDAAYWAHQPDTLKVGALPPEAVNRNVDGRRVVGPLQGFGQLWQKTYRVALAGCAATPEDVIATWKARFAEFQPPQNRFYPSLAGVAPGEVVLINAAMPGVALQTGVMVLYADDLSFTLMTPEGHPESGWVTFSAWREDDTTLAQVQSMARANDPLYELGFLLGGAAAQEAIWRHVLTSLAAHHAVVGAPVVFTRQCVDTRLQWNQVRNIWHNAAIRSALHGLGHPFRRRTR